MNSPTIVDPTLLRPAICLASVSPRRRELLAQIGVPHTIIGAHIDESVLPGEAPRDYVARMAREKALAVLGRSDRPPGVQGPGEGPSAVHGPTEKCPAVRGRAEELPVLAADTTVVLDDVIYGKPADRADSIAMLSRLSGRTHQVLTAVALADHPDGVALRLSVSAVRFRRISPEECAAYWDTGEPRDKAGGYAIQGYGAVFVESLEGSYSGVMGLPLFETAELLRAAGVRIWNGGAVR